MVVTGIETRTLRSVAGAFAVALLALGAVTGAAVAQDPRVVNSERYVPGIWIDPDGCEHWVMDDGAEGFMSPHRRRDGTPVCHRSEICGVMPTDTLFATDRYNITAQGRAELESFFRSANAVAQVAAGIGARVVDVRGFGERNPRASNDTAAGMQQNRRVEIYCLR